MSTKIEWTNETWNPLVGCTKVSAGCKNCYAERMARRLAAMAWSDIANDPFHMDGKTKYITVVDDIGWTGDIGICDRDEFEQPLHWRKPRMVFVCSMGDLFHENISDEEIRKVFQVMGKARHHTFQVLTKRPDRMFRFTNKYVVDRHGKPDPFPNIWLGVTAENQEEADKRLPILIEIPAAVRFVSVEPMLGPVDVASCGWRNTAQTDSRIDWVICGGESGLGARTMESEWAINLKEQCNEANVPFFFKQGSSANWPSYKDFDSFPKELQAREYPA